MSSKLGLGGHTFIEPLGNDPEANFEEQCAIVSACLDSGIQWIDTTYFQERVALGKVLQQIGRREGARITAWNFFRREDDDGALVGPTHYQDNHIEWQLAELQTQTIDLLVIHAHDDIDRLRLECELAGQWREAGKVKQIGLGMLRKDQLDRLPPDHPFSCLLSPYNAFNTVAAETFRAAKAAGLKTIAMSPFIRAWNLDKIGGDKRAAAELLLRWVTSQEIVDTVFVSMRRVEWVAANLAAERLGPLNAAESSKVAEWAAQIQSG